MRSATGPLLKTLKDPEPTVRASAAEALGTTGDAAAIEGLLPLLADSSAEVRVAAAGSLVALPAPAKPSPGADAPLLAALADKSPRVRAVAATLLGRWRCANAVGPLVRLLQNPGERVEVRVASCAALARFDEPAATDALEGALSQGLPAVREEAAMQYARRGDARGVAMLIILVRNSKAATSRRIEAIQLLAKLRERSAEAALSATARDPDVEVREAASRALSSLRNPSTQPTK